MHLEENGDRKRAIEHARASLAIHRKIEDPFTLMVEAWLRRRGVEP